MMSHTQGVIPTSLEGPISSFQIRTLYKKKPSKPLRDDPVEQYQRLLRYKRVVMSTLGYTGAGSLQFLAKQGNEVDCTAVDKFLDKRFVPMPKGIEFMVEFVPVFDILRSGLYMPDLPDAIGTHTRYALPTLDVVLPLVTYLTDHVMDVTLRTLEVIVPSLRFDEKNTLEPFVSINRLTDRVHKRVTAPSRLVIQYPPASSLLAILVKQGNVSP